MSDDIVKLVEYHKKMAAFYENTKAKEVKYYDERIQHHLTLIAEIKSKIYDQLSPREKIEAFIAENRYTYKVEDILEDYHKWLKGAYTSYTMTNCITSLEPQIKALLQEVNHE